MYQDSCGPGLTRSRYWDQVSVTPAPQLPIQQITRIHWCRSRFGWCGDAGRRPLDAAGNICSRSGAEQQLQEPRSLGSERAPVGLPGGTGVLELGVNWSPAGATAAEALRRWTEPGGEASACCEGFGFTSKTLRGHTAGNYTQKMSVLFPRIHQHSLLLCP